MSLVTDTAFAEPSVALAHFERRLALETDCSDVHDALKATLDFVLVDVRGPKLFEQAHVPCAVNIPHRTMSAERMAQYGKDTLFVVYCAGPHCNGANKAAVALARLGYRVKEMIGGMVGWQDEGFAVADASRVYPTCAPLVADLG